MGTEIFQERMLLLRSGLLERVHPADRLLLRLMLVLALCIAECQRPARAEGGAGNQIAVNPA